MYQIGTVLDMSSAVWLETREAAAALGVTLRSLYALVEHGEVPAHKRGRRLLFRLDDIEAARKMAAATEEERRDHDAERRRAVDTAAQLSERVELARRSRDAAIAWASREHGASLREIADATRLSTMTVKRILERAP